MIQRATLYLSIALGFGLFSTLALLQGYDFNWDDLNYHFYNGYAAVHHLTWTNIQVSMRQSYFYPWMDALYYELVVTLPPMAVALSLAALQSALFPLLFVLCTELMQRSGWPRSQIIYLSTILAVLGVLSPVNILEAGGAYGDNTSAVLVVFALMLFVLGDRPSFTARRTAFMAAAGIMAGAATAIKLTNAPFALGLGAALATRLALNVSSRPKQILLETFAGVAGGVLAFFVLYGPWGLALWTHFSNPFFPFFNQYFQSGYAQPSGFPDPAFNLPTLRDKLLFPFQRNPLTHHNDASGFFDLRAAITLPVVLANIAFVVARRLMVQPTNCMTSSMMPVSVFFLGSYIAWLFAFGINRYAVALELLAPLTCVMCVVAMGRMRSLVWVLCGAVAATLLGSSYLGRDLILRPGEHRRENGTGYFAVRYEPLRDLQNGEGLVVMLGDQAMAFTIPYFPPHTNFLRLAGSMYYGAPGYIALARGNDKANRAAAFGNKMGGLICRRLDQQSGPLFTLRPAGGPNAIDRAAMTYYGLAELDGQCVQVSSKADFALWLCRALRTPAHECASAAE